MKLVRKLLASLELLFLCLHAPVSVEDNLIREEIVIYSSNCFLDFKHHNISCTYIELHINGTTVAEGDKYEFPITEFNRTEGFKVDSCLTVSVRCIKDGIETHYIAQATGDTKNNNVTGDTKNNNATGDTKNNNATGDTKNNNVKEDSGDSNSAWIVCAAVGIRMFLIILGFIICYRNRWDKDHLPFCCKSRKKAPSEDPAVARSLCESQEAL